MWLIKKFIKKIKIFNVKWIFKNKNLQQSRHLKLLKITNIYIRNVSMHFINKFFVWWCFIIYFYFDTTLTFFEPTFFISSMWYYKSKIFLKFIQIFYNDSH
jgi:hypothetical protein